MLPVNPDQPHEALGPRKQRIPLDGNGEPIISPKKKSAMPRAIVTSTKNTKTSSSSRKTTEEPSSAVEIPKPGEQRRRSVEMEEVDDPEDQSSARSKAPRNSQRVIELSDDEDLMDVDTNSAPEEQPEENDEEELSEQYYTLI
jgi:hypothetical protein